MEVAFNLESVEINKVEELPRIISNSTFKKQGKFKKGALEVASYARSVANSMNTSVTAVTFNVNDASELAVGAGARVPNAGYVAPSAHH